MVAKSRRKSTSISEKLFSEPYRFSFFQAARLLQGVVLKWRSKGKGKASDDTYGKESVGYDNSPLLEAVKFKSFPSLKFASSEIAKIDKSPASDELKSLEQAEMQVSFIGLTGQSSAMPVHFTELEISRIREKDFALRKFYDLFNHRAISFFYRAWEKYRLPASYERAKLEEATGSDPISSSVLAMLGISGNALQKKLDIDKEDLLYYSGLFSAPNRSASSLAEALGEVLGVPVNVNQFKGEWMSLIDDDRMKLPVFPLKGQNNCLGVDSIIGSEVFTVEGKIELEIGPINNEKFQQLQPGTKGFAALNRFAQFFIGDSFHFNTKYLLEDDAIRAWHLKSDKINPQGLGINTWFLPQDISDAKREITIG